MTNHSEEKDSISSYNSINTQTGTGESLDSLTNRQGHLVTDNQKVRAVGNREPVTIENYDFFEKIPHFNRERISERFGAVLSNILCLTKESNKLI